MSHGVLLLLLAACVGEIGDLTTDQPMNPMGPGVRTGPADAGVDAGADAGNVGGVDASVRDAGVADAGPQDPCFAVRCGSGAACVAGSCRCVPGYIADGGACLPGDPGVPALRSEAQVCEAWRKGHEVTTPMPFTKTTMTCDPGTLARGGMDDALARLNMYRYLAGLAPVADSASDDVNDQACALMSAWNPAGPQAHSPPSTATCFTPQGAAGAGSSNIAWGCRSPSDAMDQWMIDWGNETTFGHRRWMLNPPLGPIGFGYYEGGNNYGSAACLGVFGSSGSGPRPPVISLPPPGFVPLELANMTWTVQGDVPFQDAGITITGASNATYAASLFPLQGSYGGSGALRIDRMGWTPAAGETYHVVLTGEGHAPVEWDVKPVSCP